MSRNIVNIGDICTTTQGVQITKLNTSGEPYEGGYRYLYIADFISDKSLSFVDDDFDAKKVTKNDLVMANTGSPGRVFKGKDGILSNNLFKISFDLNKVDRDYLFLMLSSNIFQYSLQQQMKGGIQKHLGHKTIARQEIPLPPLAEQQKIAAILDAADSLRQKDRQLIDHYTTLSQSLFLEMFGDPVTNPMGWKFERFDNLVSKDCPLTYGIVQPGDEYAGGVAIVRPVDLTSRYIQKSTLKRINPEISDKFQRTVLKGGELLLSVRGSVGVISIALPELSGANVTRGITPIWMDTNKMSTDFTFNLIQTTGVQRQIKALAKGATLIQINLKDLREMEMINPPITLQNQFAERIKLIEAQKQQAQASLEKSEALFNSLLQRAFTGELTENLAA